MRLSRWLSGILMAMPLALSAQYQIEFEGSLTAVGASGDFAPYYLNSLRHGRFSQSYTFQAEAAAWRPMDTDKRFSYGFGVDLIANATSATSYERYNAETKDWYTHDVRPSAAWFQQFYGEVKYRGVFLLAGLKEHDSALLNQNLTSGDLVESGNARPMPEVRVGFIDFQNIPFTNGWVQIQGEISYSKMMDDGWRRDQFNYYTGHIVTDEWYNYKRCYFRTKPSQPFSVTVGMQAAAIFGGDIRYYGHGKVWRQWSSKVKLKDFFHNFFPTPDGKEGFYSGSHLGSWDLKARYRLRDRSEVSAYFSWPWEDGSGIGRMNGWDGLWGLEYKASEGDYLSGLVVEYLDFTNQSGPLHLAPADWAGTTIDDQVTGADDYYNNNHHNPYCYFGRSIGTPAIMAPIYNLDGYPGYLANRMRGVHVAAEGTVLPGLDYRVKGGYRKAWGNGKFVLPTPLHSASFMVEAAWRPVRLNHLKVSGALSWDIGNMPTRGFGAMLSVKYDGHFTL